MQRNVSIKTLIASVAVAVLLTFLITFLTLTIVKEVEKQELIKDFEETDYGVFATIMELYEQGNAEIDTDLYLKLAYIDWYYKNLYVGEIDEEELIYHLSNGYIEGVGDTYGEYYTVEGFEALLDDSNGNTYGIGVYISYSEEYDAIKILTVMQGSPANEAGLLPGDVIIEVGGERVSELGYYTAIDNIKGESGTQIELTILRGETEITKTVERRQVDVQSVYSHAYEGDPSIGVVRVIEFNANTPQQFKSAIEELLENGATSLVFDMRSNPGGTLASVVEMLDYLLPEGDLVYVTNADGTVVETHTSDASCINVPMAVLTNGGTASAAELFTCALKDYERAIVVGTKTFGKGSVQSLIGLPDGTGLRFTTYLYNPPITENYHGVGITPDFEIELDESLQNKNFFEITDIEDNQLQKAVYELNN